MSMWEDFAVSKSPHYITQEELRESLRKAHEADQTFSLTPHEWHMLSERCEMVGAHHACSNKADVVVHKPDDEENKRRCCFPCLPGYLARFRNGETFVVVRL